MTRPWPNITPQFLSPLIAEYQDDNTWVLTNPLRYRSNVLGSVIVVPKGFVTDFASVPRVPIAYMLDGNTAHPAAVVHDFLYQTHITTKSLTDSIFNEAMQVVGEPYWRRWMMTTAVRVFGGTAWKTGPDRYKILQPKAGAT